MIDFVLSARCCGAGLIRSLASSHRECTDLPPRSSVLSLLAEEPDGKLRFSSTGGMWLKQCPERVVVVSRCPVKSFLCMVDRQYRHLGRALSDGEMEFYCNMFVGQVSVMSILIDLGAKFFILRRDAKLVQRVSALIEMLTGKSGVDPSKRLDEFNRASERVFYRAIDDLPPYAWNEVRRVGTFYGKLNIELEVS